MMRTCVIQVLFLLNVTNDYNRKELFKCTILKLHHHSSAEVGLFLWKVEDEKLRNTYWK